MKFRIYDSKQKHMLTHNDLYKMDCSNELPFLPLVNGFYDGILFNDNKPHKYHPMLGLDLKDHNQTEIYTGDIICMPLTNTFLTASTSVLAEVAKKYQADNAILIIHPVICHGHIITTTYLQKNNTYLLEENSEKPERFGESYESLFLQFLLTKDAYVIGNVYENPELIQNISIHESFFERR